MRQDNIGQVKYYLKTHEYEYNLLMENQGEMAV